jgi:hypothetical protein
VQCELPIVVDIVVKLYYEEVLDEKLRPPSKLHALMDKVMDQVQEDHTSTFTKHLPICNHPFGFEFLKYIQVHYNMNLEPEMFIEKLQILVSTQVMNEEKVSWLKLWN